MYDDRVAKRRRKWTQAEDRWLKNHAGDGISVLAELIGCTTSEVIVEADRLGVEVATTPDERRVCPWCGRYVSESSPSWRRAGLCDACYQMHLHECKVQRERELSARRRNDSDRKRKQRSGRI